jgi:riboflavin biosynthesis pyrimidine reductase
VNGGQISRVPYGLSRPFVDPRVVHRQSDRCRRLESFPQATDDHGAQVRLRATRSGKISTVLRLLPSPTEAVTVAHAYGTKRPVTPSGRPWTWLCMVASIDGSTVLDGASRGLSSDVDRLVLLTLRNVADMIIVGAGTVRAEGYGPPKKVGQRIGVVSHTGDVDPTLDLFTSGTGFLIIPEDAPPSRFETVRAGVGELDLNRAMAMLPDSPRLVQVEGGATLNGTLTALDLVDEINITTSPQIVGGKGSRATKNAPDTARRFDLEQLCEDDGFLFSRYVRRRHD